MTQLGQGKNFTVSENVTLSSLNTANGIVQTDGSGNLSTSTAIPNGTTGTTQSDYDGSTKLATNAYVDSAALNVSSGLARGFIVSYSSTTNVGVSAGILEANGEIYTLSYDRLVRKIIVAIGFISLLGNEPSIKSDISVSAPSLALLRVLYAA